jgi:Flp pilus assembly pilin Flp
MNGASAATAIEYALITACISLALIVVLQNTGFALAGIFAGLSAALGNGWHVVAVP